MPRASTKKDCEAILRRVGLRRTEPRLAVLAVMTRTAAPVTHGDVVEALASSGIDRATVYRNLTELVRAGVLTRSDFGDRVWRFALAKAESEHEPSDHPHFLCASCGGITCMPEGAVKVSLAGTARAKQTVAVRVTGVCDACA